MRKFAENKQADNQRTTKQSENSKTEATLIPCGSWGRAGQFSLIYIKAIFIEIQHNQGWNKIQGYYYRKIDQDCILDIFNFKIYPLLLILLIVKHRKKY